MYVCNMDVVGSILPGDPVVARITEALASSASDRAAVGLVVGAPGFGKSSVLAAAASAIARRTRRVVIWVSGAVVASEGHLARLLASALAPVPTSSAGTAPLEESVSLETALRRLTRAPQRILLAIDDFDALVFKRERVAEQLGHAVASGDEVQLLASCHPAARDRLTAATHPFAAAVGGPIICVTITPLDPAAASSLIRRRTPSLSTAATRRVIAAAGGHPAALVYLSRLLGLRAQQNAPAASDGAGECRVGGTGDDRPDAPRGFFNDAAEFAGAVYAESWAALGPQQRAILWQLGMSTTPASAADIAHAIELPASHVSAQLTRLVAEGLVRRTEPRGHFDVAPLLAQWIARRAARGGPRGSRHVPSERTHRTSTRGTVKADAVTSLAEDR